MVGLSYRLVFAVAVVLLVDVAPLWVARVPAPGAMTLKPPSRVNMASSKTDPVGALATAKAGKAAALLKDVDS